MQKGRPGEDLNPGHSLRRAVYCPSYTTRAYGAPEGSLFKNVIVKEDGRGAAE